MKTKLIFLCIVGFLLAVAVVGIVVEIVQNGMSLSVATSIAVWCFAVGFWGEDFGRVIKNKAKEDSKKE